VNRDQVLKDAVGRIAEVVEQLRTPVNQRDLLLIKAGVALGVDVTFAEVDRLRAELAEERKTRAELGRLIGALGRAGGVPT
jgi:hypothetical protein